MTKRIQITPYWKDEVYFLQNHDLIFIWKLHITISPFLQMNQLSLKAAHYDITLSSDESVVSESCTLRYHPVFRSISCHWKLHITISPFLQMNQLSLKATHYDITFSSDESVVSESYTLRYHPFFRWISCSFIGCRNFQRNFILEVTKHIYIYDKWTPSHCFYLLSIHHKSVYYISFALCLISMFLNPFSAGIVFRRQNLTSVDVRFWSLKTIPALKELKKIYNGHGPIT